MSSLKILLAKTLSQYYILYQGLQCIFSLKSGHVEILPRSIVTFSCDIWIAKLVHGFYHRAADFY